MKLEAIVIKDSCIPISMLIEEEEFKTISKDIDNMTIKSTLNDYNEEKTVYTLDELSITYGNGKLINILVKNRLNRDTAQIYLKEESGKVVDIMQKFLTLQMIYSLKKSLIGFNFIDEYEGFVSTIGRDFYQLAYMYILGV